MNYLCLDFGLKRIGVAIATTPIAEPLAIIPNSPKSGDLISSNVLPAIEKLLREYEINLIIVGISEGEMARKSHSFALLLRETFALTVEEADETLSSQEAMSRTKGLKKSKQRAPQDHLAAALILQDYLDLHESEL